MKPNIKKIMYYIFIILCLFVFIFSTKTVIFWMLEHIHTKELQKQTVKNVKEKLSQSEKTNMIDPPKNPMDDSWNYMNESMLSVDFNELLKINTDTVGWIRLNGSQIDYPVVQTTNNDYYLHHSYDQSKNNAGWVFADYRNNMNNFDKNTIIYGHGRLDNTMFGSLKDTLKSTWYNDKSNYIVKFSTPKYNTLWQVFSVYSIQVEDYYITTTFKSENEYKQFLTVLKKRSIKNFHTDLSEKDKIITLSTCKDAKGKERIVLHAKLIKIENNNI